LRKSVRFLLFHSPPENPIPPGLTRKFLFSVALAIRA
jgi:hypothetical protein